MVTKLLNIDPRIVFTTHSRFGNTVSASLPLNISIAEEEGRLKRGMQVLLTMGSAGVTSAFCAFRSLSSAPNVYATRGHSSPSFRSRVASTTTPDCVSTMLTKGLARRW